MEEDEEGKIDDRATTLVTPVETREIGQEIARAKKVRIEEETVTSPRGLTSPGLSRARAKGGGEMTIEDQKDVDDLKTKA